MITIVELKRLFQGSMSLEDFHTKALRLVKEVEYPEGNTQNRVLRDTIISGLASDKIDAKVIKEGKDVTLASIMEIALNWKFPPRGILTECRKQLKSTMYSMGRELRRASPNKGPVVAVVAVMVVAAVSTLGNPPNQLEKVGKFHYPLISVGDVGNQDTRKVNTVKLWKQSAEAVEQKCTTRRCV